MIDAGGHTLEVERIGAAPDGRPTLVFLHEGLGSVAMWRDFPANLARMTHCNAVIYSRHGYGRSEPLAASRTVRYMHDEALIVLPELLDHLEIMQPVLVGHSDGGSIALIHAGSGVRPVRAVIAIAPHVMVEDISVHSIAAAREAFEKTDLPRRLARYHDNVESAFWGWNRIWLDPAFRDWNIESFLAGVTCPVLAIQGEDDEYGTREQVLRIARRVRDAEVIMLPDCGHSPHRDAPEALAQSIVGFIDRLCAIVIPAGPPGDRSQA